ncbi:MAG: hypothetical protein JOZ91_01180 [Candidatus Eremiobacteraeota bacterium]|nr:hypothetical protein [Candidatus Eremiobacteraeota bacterium]MBV8339461.1 hypothetical protein [Candidatus Eremiobacteraeota bacterium]
MKKCTRFSIGILALALILIVIRTQARADDAGFVWAYALHDSYSNDTFYSADFTKPFGPSAPIRPYAELLLQRDSQTTTGVLPQTFNDNYGLAAAGMQLETNSGLRFFAQIGTSFDFGPAIQDLPTSSHFDGRGGVQYDREWNVPPSGANRYFGTFFGDFVYYSRYRNGLMYFEAERGREFGSRTYPLQIYVRLSGSQDTQREYYNDAIALAGGAGFLVLGRHGPSVGFTESFNSYTTAVPYGVLRSYWSFRPQITYGASF